MPVARICLRNGSPWSSSRPIKIPRRVKSNAVRGGLQRINPDNAVASILRIAVHYQRFSIWKLLQLKLLAALEIPIPLRFKLLRRVILKAPVILRFADAVRRENVNGVSLRI